ncbi:Spore germination protein B1 [compost metagenome]
MNNSASAQRNPSTDLPQLLSIQLVDNLEMVKSIYADCTDLIVHEFELPSLLTKAMIIYLDGLSDAELLDRQVLSPLKFDLICEKEQLMATLKKELPLSQSKEIHTREELIEEVSMGNPVLIIDESCIGLSLGLIKWEKRGIEEPIAESVIRGPRDGFTETLKLNISLLRRRLRNPDFKMKTITLGHYTKTQIVVAYIEGIATYDLVAEVTSRLEGIEVDGILESGNIEEMIEDSPWSPFPQLLSTERPDCAVGNLLEGRIVILTEGTPMALIAPITLYSMLQSPEDYYQRYILNTMVRWLRYVFFLIALIAPSMYVAILTFHQEMLPTTLMLSIAKSREEIPFPALVEAFLMEITFEALREAGVRLPKQVGAAVSIVGALVIGQAATSAGLVSAPMVMVVAITGIASFMIPHYTMGIAIRVLRFPIMLMAGMLGLLGILLAVIVIVIHLCQLRSFGLPYLDPLAPMLKGEWKDILIRVPMWAMNQRPKLTGRNNRFRQAYGNRPKADKGDSNP